MTGPRPFLDGPFRLQMGLRALAADDWLDRSPAALAQISRRRALLGQRADEVSLGLPASLPAQRETDALIRAELRTPQQEGARDAIGVATGPLAAPGPLAAIGPLAAVGALVAEDLCLMEAHDDGYRLTAGVLCFPLHWSLREKLGRPIDVIHGPVPGFGERLATPVARFFRNLDAARPVWRANWSLVDSAELFLPPAHRGTASAFDRGDPGGTLWLRTERQTLRRLPETGAILFTIRTAIEALAEVVREPGTAQALAARVREMPEAMARYKGITPVREPLLAYLDGLSNGEGGSAPPGLTATG